MKRSSPGRPPQDGTPRSIHAAARLKRDDYNYVLKIGRGSFSVGLRELINFHKKGA